MPRIEFNHAMVYARDVERSLAFYRDRLGLEVIEAMPGYARIRAGNGTIGLHALEPGRALDPAKQGLRLYFEVEALDALCAELAAAGVAFLQPPKDMPWGWRHAYLLDPDGHEISLYTAGPKRFEPTRW